MKPGSVISLVLWIALTAFGTAVAAAFAYVEQLALLPPSTQIWAIAGAMGVINAGIMMLLGVVIGRSIRNLCQYIEGSADTDHRAYVASRWLRPVTRAVTGVVDRFRVREQSLHNQLRDLEVRHRVSEAERRQIEAVLHSLRDGVLVTNAFGDLAMANPSAAAILGFTLKDSIHQSVDRVLSDPRLRELMRTTAEHADFDNCRHVEHEIVVETVGDDDRPLDIHRLYDVSLICVPNHKQEVGGVVMILHDLTRERELSRMKSEFVSKASHELRTPLAAIQAYVEMLIDGEAEDVEDRQEFCHIIQGETERLSRLIDNMLNISRIEAGIVQIERTSVDIKALVGRVLETMEPEAVKKNISLHEKLSPVALNAEGNADMLYRVIVNLVSNAIKYTPDGGRITVSADSDNLTRSTVVTVADTGLGIPPDSLDKVFEKFYRIESYKRVAKGTGLGLSLCKHIVETVHHGHIGVKSEVGMGSQFWFSIPMQYAGTKAA